MPNAFPEWLEPMAATLTHERFAGPEWIFERKFDGIRLLAFKDALSVRLFSRNRLPQDYPSVAQAIADVREVAFDKSAGGAHVAAPAEPCHERRRIDGRLPLRRTARHFDDAALFIEQERDAHAAGARDLLDKT